MNQRDDLEDLTKTELQDHLRDLDEPVSGTKAELVDRLQEARTRADSSDGPSSGSGNDDTDADPDGNGRPPRSGDWSEHLDVVNTTVRRLTNCEVESIVGIAKTDEGWTFGVQVVEARRVPSTADLVAVIEVGVDADGAVTSLARTSRGRRDQVIAS